MTDKQEDRQSDSLGLDGDEMRRLGHWVVDRVVDHFERGPERPVIQVGDPDGRPGRTSTRRGG